MDGQIIFQAKAFWLKGSLPFNAENLRELTFSNAAGECLYTTRYKFIDNRVEESIPFKYLLTKEQCFGQQAADELEQILAKIMEQNSAQGKKILKIIGIIFGMIIIF